MRYNIFWWNTRDQEIDAKQFKGIGYRLEGGLRQCVKPSTTDRTHLKVDTHVHCRPERFGESFNYLCFDILDVGLRQNVFVGKIIQNITTNQFVKQPDTRFSSFGLQRSIGQMCR